MNDDDENGDEREHPPKPASARVPDYPEQRAKQLHKIPTGSWDMRDVVHVLKKRRAERYPKLIAQVVAALSALGIGSAGMWKAFAAHGTADASTARDVLIEYRLGEEVKARERLELETADSLKRLERDHFDDVEKQREQLERVRIRQASCCPRKGEENR